MTSWPPKVDPGGIVSLWRVTKALAGVVAAMAAIGTAVRWYVQEVTADVAVKAALADQHVSDMQRDAVIQAGRVADLTQRVKALEVELQDEVQARVQLEGGDKAAAAFSGMVEGRWPCVQGAPCASLRRAAEAAIAGAKRR